MDKNDDFPYVNDLYDDNFRINKFIEFINYNLPFEKLDKNYKIKVNVKLPRIHFLYKNKSVYLLKRQLKTYQDVLCLSDSFVDICRAHCNMKGYLSPYEYYKKNKNNIIKKLKKNNMELSKRNIRNAIYEGNVECSPHNSAIIKKFIEKYKATKILDMSAGWGDRLLGCMAAKIYDKTVKNYTAADPNSCLHKYYKNMIDLLSPYSPNTNCKYNIIEDGFENLKVEKNYYELAYTSPPYFDFEVYSTDEKQSINTYNSEDAWYTNFLQPSVIKFIDGLVDGGHMVLYIAQEYGKTYMEKFFDWIKYYDNIYYYGCVFYGVVNKDGLVTGHPMYIYKKSSRIPTFLFNMVPQIESIRIPIINDSINVIMDNYMVGGFYTRFIFDFIRTQLNNIEIILCVDKINKYVCISIAYTLFLLKKKDIRLVFYNFDYDNDIKQICNYYYGNIDYYDISWVPNSDSSNESILNITNEKLFSKECEHILYNNISKYDIYSKIKNLWLFITFDESLFILNVLIKLLNKTTIRCVVNKDEYTKINELIKKTYSTAIYKENKIKIKIYPSKFNSNENYDINLDLNYSVDYNTDAKIWEYISKNNIKGKNDYILNSANIIGYL